MLWTYITVTLILVSGLPVKSEETPDNAAHSKAEDFMQARCLKYGSADSFKELKSLNFSGRPCYPRSYETDNDEELFNIACVELPKEGQHCLEDLMSKVEPCLAPEEKYLTSFFLESFNTSIEQQCKDGMAHVRKLEKQLSSATCSLPVSQVMDRMGEKCLSQLELYKVLDDPQPDFILTESFLCGDLLKGKECITGVLKKYCEDGVFAELFDTVIEPFTTWCEKHKSEDNYMFLRFG